MKISGEENNLTIEFQLRSAEFKLYPLKFKFLFEFNFYASAI